MTLFRVLSEEESKSVTRWKAPKLGASQDTIANTPQHAKPSSPEESTAVKALLGSLDLQPGRRQSQPAPMRLQSISPVDVFSNGPLNLSSKNSSEETITPVSAELLQSSYDEGYARGFATGNAALEQQSIKELRKLIEAMSQATVARPDQQALEQELVALSMDVAQLIIRRELSVKPEVIYEIVVAGIEQLPMASTSQSVFLHPLDASIVRSQLPADTSVSVIDEPTLNRGDCRIESGASVLQAGVADWLTIAAGQLGLEAPDNDPDLEAGD